MKVLLIPDSFKDCLSAALVAKAMERAVLEVDASATVRVITASDGGEGFLDSIAGLVPSATFKKCSTSDPLGRPLDAPYLVNTDKNEAFIELARASGLELLAPPERNPLRTSTYGTGVQISQAIEQGATLVYVGLGGSSTNDGGTGMATALGYRFLDRQGKELHPCGENLTSMAAIEPPAHMPAVRFVAVNDVQNPLCGPRGAAFTYGLQKGARDEDLQLLDDGLQNLARLCKVELGRDNARTPGSGAAGGAAFGLKTFLGARYMPGVSFVLELAGFSDLIERQGIDLIITGEGTIDQQTFYGKMVAGVAREAGRYDVPVLAVCGKLDLDDDGIRKLGLRDVAALYNPSQPPGYSFRHASRLVYERTLALLG